MKLIQAIIQPFHLTAVLAALERVAVERLTVLDAHSYGMALAQDRLRPVDLATVHRNVILEIVVNDDFVDRTLSAIQEAGRTGLLGRPGDGKIWVLPVEETIRIGEVDRGPGAV
jgi:nitrogen regulatory protein P-II 1